METQQSYEFNVSEHFVEVHRTLTLLKTLGFVPDFIIDVGASTGCWSYHSWLVYPSARHILIEPLADLYRGGSQGPWLAESFPKFELLETGVLDYTGQVMLNIAPDIASSSVFTLPTGVCERRVEIPVTTLDDIARQKGLHGRGILKLDIQYSEHLALKGAQELIHQVDAVVMELSLLKNYVGSATFFQMLKMMDEFGFQYFDDLGTYRRPDGILGHKDAMFLRKSCIELSPTAVKIVRA